MTVSKAAIRYRMNTISRRLLMTAGISLTNRCNLKCVHCYVREDGGGPSRKEMSTADVVRLIREIRGVGATNLDITGGEPLLRPDFEEIYRAAKENNFAVAVLTNATLMTDRLVKMFRKYPPRTLDVSCYGMTKKTYESITQAEGSFEQFQQALKKLRKSGVRVFFKFIAMRSNYREAPQAEKVAEKMGMCFRCFCSLWRRIDRDEKKNVRIDRERLTADETIELFRSIREDIGKFYVSYGECGYSSGCGAASIGCVCDPYGMIVPCSFLREPRASALKIGFQRAWDSIAKGSAPSKKKPRACLECRHKVYCKWCPGASYTETGCPNEVVPYLCRLMDDLYEKKAIGCR